jgi:hypothetical protein
MTKYVLKWTLYFLCGNNISDIWIGTHGDGIFSKLRSTMFKYEATSELELKFMSSHFHVISYNIQHSPFWNILITQTPSFVKTSPPVFTMPA